MIDIPLSQVGSSEQFADDVEAHRKALAAHLLGQPGQPAPVASQWIEAVIRRVPQSGPVAKRGPDRFEVADYRIVDDRPKPPEVVKAIEVLRESMEA